MQNVRSQNAAQDLVPRHMPIVHESISTEDNSESPIQHQQLLLSESSSDVQSDEISIDDSDS